MNLYAHMRIAEDMEVSKGFVIQAQKRWLKTQIEYTDEQIAEVFDWVDGVYDVNEVYALRELDTLCQKKSKLMQAYKATVNSLKPSQEAITDEMIDRAKGVSVESVVDFTRGLAVAFCHEDRKPSLTLNRKTGKARCFVCDKSFNSIDILCERDNMSFIQAVKQLCK